MSTVGTVGTVTVWWARPADLRPAHLGLLDRVEWERHGRYLMAADRDRFAMGVVLTRAVLGNLLRVPPAQVALDRTCPGCGAPHGRPRTAGPWRVSVSHSGDRIAVAVIDAGDVGVDVEARTGREVADLVVGVLAPPEAAAVAELPAAEREAAFLSYWTRKEAVLKATGDGLGADPDAVVVSAPDAVPAVLAWPARPGMVDRLTLHALDPGPGHVAYLAVLDAPGATVRERDAAELPGVASGAG